ncbi:MAG: radical SAM protein [Lentisphaerae bacterium]|jgi:biotin synthase|nr:radical SAM protein [Lentisphaerota bacterium]
MKINTDLVRILERAQQGDALSKADCITLLEYAPTSVEAGVIRGVADALARRRFGNEAIILGQVGIEISACPAKCKFCSFGEGHTQFAPSKMTPEEILEAADRFTASGDLYALFLMTMHTFDFDSLLDVVQRIRSRMPTYPQIVVNIGDFDRAQAEALRQVGVNGAYHVCRLREGTDTTLDPEDRKRTIRVIKDAGLDWYYCCEPIGPEHTAQELVDQLFLGIEYGCFQHAAMRRVWMPNSPLAQHGQISELRQAQVVAVVALASLGCPDTRNIAVHEPNLIGLSSGANVVYAETGANPRDTEEDTSSHRGRDIRACKTMLYEAGFEHLLVAPNERRPLGNAFRE